MNKKTSASARRSAAALPTASDPAGPMPLWPGAGWMTAWIGAACLPWMNYGLRAMNAWIEQIEAAGGTAVDSDERRRAGLPWMPWFESSVVQLQRRDDAPGAEAAKLSWRFRVPPMPWEEGDGRVIAIASLQPRPKSNGEADQEPRSPTRH